MRITSTLLVAVGLASLAGCTVKSVEAPPLAGPSTLATSILLQATPDSILQDSSTSTVTATALGPDGRPISNLDLRAEIFVDGVAQDFGSLSPKSLRTGSDGIARFIYTAPPRPAESVGVGTLVTIAVTPVGADYRGEVRRQVDINVVPPGVILPPNGAPVPSFIITPTPANTRQVLNFDASATTDEGVACGGRCTYAWTFGDNTGGAGMVTTHEYRATGLYTVTLTVTDQRGTAATATQTLVVGSTGLPTAGFTFSPPAPAIAQEVFFNAQQSTAVPGRRIVNYGWDFGDGRSASGVTVSRSYAVRGTYVVTLTVTDDSDARAVVSQSVVVGGTGTGPTAIMTVSPSAGVRVGTSVFFDGSGSTAGPSPIRTYRFDYGDGTNDVGDSPRQSHIYAAAGSYTVRLTVTDSEGRSGTITISVTVAP